MCGTIHFINKHAHALIISIPNLLFSRSKILLHNDQLAWAHPNHIVQFRLMNPESMCHASDPLFHNIRLKESEKQEISTMHRNCMVGFAW
jgi:hypothetical protein